MLSRTTLLMCALASVLAGTGSAPAQTTQPAVIPAPVRLQTGDAAFRFADRSSLLVSYDNVELRRIAEHLATALEPQLGRRLLPRHAQPTDSPDGHILLSVERITRGPAADPEGYFLTVTPGRVALRGAGGAGVFRGVQTLRQLVQQDANGRWIIPAVTIEDGPRYRWRGMLLDCGRHFMDKEFVKRYIDLLAYHKMNVLHWHLTEDQGWRIEIKKFPKLTEIGAWRRATRDSEQPRTPDGRYGGFYTQDDIREIVAYAAARYITVVPEIEMPGHSVAALASYPELSCTGGPFSVRTEWGVSEDVYCAGNDATFAFLEDVLGEVLELFPSEFIHVGGDECPKKRWQACPKCQARIKAEGLKDEAELQSYFIRRIERFLNSRGRRLIGWDEILEGGLAPNATVQSWRGMNGALAAARAGHDVIASPTSHCYIDYPQGPDPFAPGWMGFIDLPKIYSFEPTPGELTPQEARHILGAECNMWTEHAPQSRIDWMVFPRLCALAEVTWSPPAVQMPAAAPGADTAPNAAQLPADAPPPPGRSWADFAGRMQVHYERLDVLGVRYYIPPPAATVRPVPPPGELAPSAAPAAPVFNPKKEKDTAIRLPAAGLELTLVNPHGRGVIRYTRDGTAPTASSPEYTAPLNITEPCTLKVRVFLSPEHASDTTEYRFVVGTT